MAELGTLYTTARGLTALAPDAERELLPRITAFGGRLRRCVRGGTLDAAAIDAASLEVLAVRSEWQTRVEAVRSSAAYRAACVALAADRQDEVAALIPRVFAGLRPAVLVPPLFVPMSVSTGRRRPGTSPFLSAPEAAERIARLVHDGLEACGESGAAWEQDLPSVSCTDDPAVLDTPVALRVEPAVLRATAFAVVGSPTYRVFTARRVAAGSVWLATDPADTWWEAYEVSYAAFRDALRDELAQRDVAVHIGQPEP